MVQMLVFGIVPREIVGEGYVDCGDIFLDMEGRHDWSRRGVENTRDNRPGSREGEMSMNGVVCVDSRDCEEMEVWKVRRCGLEGWKRRGQGTMSKFRPKNDWSRLEFK